MTRDLRRLADTKFDLIVVGAGFYGVTVAWDAAQRGLSVAIIDKDDFGAATSFNNLKTLHGGLRSLQSLNFRQMRLFIRERRALARILPHLVRPLPFVVATTRNPKRSSLAMRLAFAVNDFVARDRNEGLADPGSHLPASQIISKEEALRLNPIIAPEGVTGGAIWHDYQMLSTDRVTLSFLLSAVDAGATAANYVKANRFIREGDRVVGVRAEDLLSGNTFDLRGSVVVNCAGPWAASMLTDLPQAAQGAPPPRLSRAMNVITRKVVTSHACGGMVGRTLPVHGAVARCLDAGHQPRRLRRLARPAQGVALGPGGVPERRPRGLPPCRPDHRRCEADSPRPAAHGVGRRRPRPPAEGKPGRRPPPERAARAGVGLRRALHHCPPHRRAGRRSTRCSGRSATPPRPPAGPRRPPSWAAA